MGRGRRLGLWSTFHLELHLRLPCAISANSPSWSRTSRLNRGARGAYWWLLRWPRKWACKSRHFSPDLWDWRLKFKGTEPWAHVTLAVTQTCPWGNRRKIPFGRHADWDSPKGGWSEFTLNRGPRGRGGSDVLCQSKPTPLTPLLIHYLDQEPWDLLLCSVWLLLWPQSLSL